MPTINENNKILTGKILLSNSNVSNKNVDIFINVNEKIDNINYEYDHGDENSYIGTIGLSMPECIGYELLEISNGSTTNNKKFISTFEDGDEITLKKAMVELRISNYTMNSNSLSGQVVLYIAPQIHGKYEGPTTIEEFDEEYNKIPDNKRPPISRLWQKEAIIYNEIKYYYTYIYPQDKLKKITINIEDYKSRNYNLDIPEYEELSAEYIVSHSPYMTFKTWWNNLKINAFAERSIRRPFFTFNIEQERLKEIGYYSNSDDKISGEENMILNANISIDDPSFTIEPYVKFDLGEYFHEESNGEIYIDEWASKFYDKNNNQLNSLVSYGDWVKEEIKLLKTIPSNLIYCGFSSGDTLIYPLNVGKGYALWGSPNYNNDKSIYKIMEIEVINSNPEITERYNVQKELEVANNARIYATSKVENMDISEEEKQKYIEGYVQNQIENMERIGNTISLRKLDESKLIDSGKYVEYYHINEFGNNIKEIKEIINNQAPILED